MTAAEALRIAQEQDAWGKWNTASAWRRYYELRRQEQTPLRRMLPTIATATAVIATLALWSITHV